MKKALWGLHEYQSPIWPLFWSLGEEPRGVQVGNPQPELVHPPSLQGPASCSSAEMTQLVSAPPTRSKLTIKKGRVDACGQRRIHAFWAQPPDETSNNLVRNANIKRQPRHLFSNQYGIRSVGVRCAQPSCTRLECFDFCRRLLLERRSWFHPRPHASLRILRLEVKHMQTLPAVVSCGRRDTNEEWMNLLCVGGRDDQFLNLKMFQNWWAITGFSKVEKNVWDWHLNVFCSWYLGIIVKSTDF